MENENKKDLETLEENTKDTAEKVNTEETPVKAEDESIPEKSAEKDEPAEKSKKEDTPKTDSKDKEKKTEGKDEKDKSGKQRNLRTAIICIAILIIIFILMLLRSCGSAGPGAGGDVTPPAANSGPVFDLDEEDAAGEKEDPAIKQAQIQEELNQKVKDGMINISMSTNPIFENGKAEGIMAIENKDINTHPQVVEIYLKGENGELGDLIYKTKLIPVGKYIETDTLDVELEKGEYDCIAYFNSVDEETGNLLGKAGAEIKITILN